MLNIGDQKLIDIIFELGMTIRSEKEYFKDNEITGEWIAKQLSNFGIYTTPVGSSW